MRALLMSVVLALVATGMASAIPSKAEGEGDADHKTRVLQKELSDENHFMDEDHNPEYDHEAFLGREESRTFDQLSPEESKEKLAILYDKIDADHDGQVTETELEQWIHKVQRKYLVEDTKRQWEEHNPEDEKLSWQSYKKRTYGFTEDDPADDFDYKEMIERDERRWAKADVDEDKLLNQEEFSNFLHPEDAAHMRDIVITETIEDIDKDGDGLISLDEYIADLWDGEEDDEDEEGEGAPEWIEEERDDFQDSYDKNQDGILDRDEVADWIMPQEEEDEVKHLMTEADSNNDQALTKEEVLDKWDLFVGSQATEFGEALVRHDEF